jgi:hypothetical protein
MARVFVRDNHDLIFSSRPGACSINHYGTIMYRFVLYGLVIYRFIMFGFVMYSFFFVT